MNHIGERIKKKRELLGLQLNDLAKKVGISPSGLSQIEKMKASPSLFTLKTIADNLNTTVGELIGENEGTRTNPIIRAKEVQMIESNAGGAGIYQLSHHDINKQMDNFLVKLPRGANSDGFFTNHHGQHFCHITKGKVLLKLDDAEYKLQQGDNVFFNSKNKYQFINESIEGAELIWVISQPNY